MCGGMLLFYCSVIDKLPKVNALLKIVYYNAIIVLIITQCNSQKSKLGGTSFNVLTSSISTFYSSRLCLS